MRSNFYVSLFALSLSLGAIAQTTVTTGGGTTNTVPMFTGTATLGSTPIAVSGGNVGIGTTSPTYPLHIKNSTTGCGNELAAYNGSNYAIVTIQGSSPCVGSWPANSSVFESNQGGLVLDALGSNPILFQSNRVTAMSLTSGGKVGIGNTNPLYLLDVAGQIRTTSGGVIFPDGSTQTTAFNPAAINDPVIYGASGTTQAPIASFINGTNQAYTAIDAAGSASVVPSWANGSQILEFNPYGAGNGIVSSYTGNLLFQTNNRTTQMTILANGSVGIGTNGPSASLEVAGNVKLTAGSGASLTYQDGSVQTVAWNGVLSGGDYAESVDVVGERAQYEPGDVLVIDPSSKGRFMKSTEAYSTAVMGIYSTRPGVVGRRQKTEKSHMKDEVPMAMVGVVPTKVSAEGGAIKPGDLLVTSSKPGYAMKGMDRSLLTGAIIGKALEPLDAGIGVIEVAVSIQ